jgi:hypothetical protein
MPSSSFCYGLINLMEMNIRKNSRRPGLNVFAQVIQDGLRLDGFARKWVPL